MTQDDPQRDDQAGRVHLLWDSGNGTGAVWRLRPDGAADRRPFGPFAGWAARALAAGPDGRAFLPWRHDGGLASVRRLGAAGGVGHAERGPCAGRAPVALAVAA